MRWSVVRWGRKDAPPATDMPRLAWDALEAGLDGPALRQLAALDFPTFFQVQEVLPRAMAEMHLSQMDKVQAGLRLAKLRAQEILESKSDPFLHLGDFNHLWIATDYCRELTDYGPLADDVYVARCMGQSEQEIRNWLNERLNKLAGT